MEEQISCIYSFSDSTEIRHPIASSTKQPPEEKSTQKQYADYLIFSVAKDQPICLEFTQFTENKIQSELEKNGQVKDIFEEEGGSKKLPSSKHSGGGARYFYL